jgi:RNA 2',3'-cyclic 3'-phosphodiesterase
MRTFIAVPLPKECQILLEQMQQSLRACQAEVRWVAIPFIHLTLKFLGEVDPEAISKLNVLLSEICKSEHRFELRLRGFGCFPNVKNPRIIWCGIEGETDSLLRLQHIVEYAGTKLGFAPEDRPFHPHLTLGRIQGRRNLQPLMDRIAEGSDLACGFHADHFQIYKSSLKPQGAVYTVLNTIVLNEC